MKSIISKRIWTGSRTVISMLYMTYRLSLNQWIHEPTFFLNFSIQYIFYSDKYTSTNNSTNQQESIFVNKYWIQNFCLPMNRTPGDSRSICAARSMDLRLTTSLRSLAMWSVMFWAVSPLLMSRGEGGPVTGWSSFSCSNL